MENYSYSSYPDSGHSSPRSREIDCENASWDDPPSSSYKVKFMCSYGGKIHPRPHDNQLAYVGGDTKILSVDRNIRFSGFISKLSSLCDAEVCFKYQLPGEDLDALISVTNDEDLEHMMLEYDRVYRASAKPVRLRLFLFPLDPPSSFGSTETKSERQWFVDALNSVQIPPLEASSPPPAVASPANPDFLFGLDKGHAPPAAVGTLQDPPPPPTVPELFPKEIHAGSDCGSEDRHLLGEPVVSPAEIQRQIQELQRLHIASHEQAMFQRKIEETNPRAYSGDYYAQKVPEKAAPAQQAVPVSIPAGYWQERHMTTGGYPVAAAPGSEQPVYLIPTQAGMYQSPAMRPMTGQVGQPYYGMQRMVPEVYREQPVYNAVPPQSIQQPKMGAYTEAIGMVRPAAGGGVGVADPGYAQVSYDGAGRQVYYTAQGGMLPPYQAVGGVVDVRQGGGALNQEGSGKKEELENGCAQTMCRTYGAGTGAVRETAIRRLIGLESTIPEVGTSSNHFSTDSLGTGFRSSCRGIELVPILLGDTVMSKLEGEYDISSKSSSPVGSHWKEATCFSPGSDEMLNLLLVLKSRSGCFLLRETKRLPV